MTQGVLEASFECSNPHSHQLCLVLGLASCLSSEVVAHAVGVDLCGRWREKPVFTPAHFISSKGFLVTKKKNKKKNPSFPPCLELLEFSVNIIWIKLYTNVIKVRWNLVGYTWIAIGICLSELFNEDIQYMYWQSELRIWHNGWDSCCQTISTEVKKLN